MEVVNRARRPNRMSFALRGAIGYGLGGVFIMMVTHLYNMSRISFNGADWPASLLAYIVGLAIASWWLIDTKVGFVRVRASLFFGALFYVYEVGVGACFPLVVYYLFHITAQQVYWLPPVLIKAVLRGIASGLCWMSFRNCLRIEAGRAFSIWLLGFLAFVLSGVILFGSQEAVKVVLSRHLGMFDTPVEFAFAGFLFGAGLDVIAAKAAQASRAADPRSQTSSGENNSQCGGR